MPAVAKVSGPRECQVRFRRQVEEEECYEEEVNYAGHGIPDNRVDSVVSPEACQEACLLRVGCQVIWPKVGYSLLSTPFSHWSALDLEHSGLSQVPVYLLAQV